MDHACTETHCVSAFVSSFSSLRFFFFPGTLDTIEDELREPMISN